MLEIKNLRKIYKPKHGVPVAAIDGVTVDFPDSGMVFLLGKSGSGKSTLLNLLGGLDKYDDGEIIIKGVSSKTFRQQHFDSYRNTYVGFVFQEYNVLEEFTVGANIALAIELQGKKATDEQISRILHEVDLDGYGDRKPNELSGGQKQRVAIARALVKNPEIIMADEPTGALDSNTGRQVLETLKRLSENKLVIVVSHDRDFAERYGDRIIELADGKIINDVTRISEPSEDHSGITFEADTVTVPADYRLSEEDRLAINKYLDELKQGITIKAVKGNGTFAATSPEVIKHKDSTPFAPVKSRLPLKNAFIIGGSGLKHKKIRLAVTVILSVIAFCLFGLADTFAAYDHVTACSNSIVDSNITYASISYEEKRGEGTDTWWNQKFMKQSDISKVRSDTGIDFKGVYYPSDVSMDFSEQFDMSKFSENEGEVRSTMFHGFAELTEQDLSDLDFKLTAGTLPDASKDEIAISMYTFDTFRRAGYAEYNGSGEKRTSDDFIKISAPSDMIGKTIRIGRKDYTVTGVIETGYDMERYEPLAKEQPGTEEPEVLLNFALTYEMHVERSNSLSAVAFVGKGKVDELCGNTSYYGSNYDCVFSSQESGCCFTAWRLITLDRATIDGIVWFDEEKKSLGEKELLVNLECMNFDNIDMSEASADEIGELISSEEFHLEYCVENITSEDGYRVVGIFSAPGDEYMPDAIVSDKMFGRFVNDTDRVYRYAVAPMPRNEQDIRSLVKYCYGSGTNAETRFGLNSPVTFELDAINEVLNVLSRVFLYIGIGFAAFAALMLTNFIGTSIVYKKREIGILRAIGSRSNDVFRIFFSESFIIAMINFVTSSVLTGVATALINYFLRKGSGMLITVLDFSVRQVLLLLAVSILVALAASFFPVRRIASKRPIDAIRDR